MPSQQASDQFLMMNAKFFKNEQLQFLDQQIKTMSEDDFRRIQYLNFKDPVITLLISIFAGSFGVDRFFIGDITLGIVKLLTCGGFGIWTIVDWFLIMNITREKNMEEFQRASTFGYGVPPYSNSPDINNKINPPSDRMGNPPTDNMGNPSPPKY